MVKGRAALARASTVAWVIPFLACPDGSVLRGDPPRFVRGDVNASTHYDLNDAILLLEHLFRGNPERLDCEKAGDANDDGSADLGDAITLLHLLFFGGSIPAPYQDCGSDPTEDLLVCESYWPCATGSLRNSIGLKLVPIPAGVFMMGSPTAERSRQDDEVLHQVTLTCPFYMGETEVTAAQYMKVMDEPPSGYERLGQFPGNLEVYPDASISFVTWMEADLFCKKLSALEGRAYRLPTEAEWEYACRAGSTTRFWFSDLLECSDDCCPPCEPARPFMFTIANDKIRSYIAVGQKLPNPFGLYDMHGTVTEWCRDWYGPYPPGPVVDPVGPLQGTQKVARGWPDVSPVVGIAAMRSALRGSRVPTAVASNRGFRIVLQVPSCAYAPYTATRP